MKLFDKIQNKLKMAKRPIHLSENPLGFGRLSAWHNPNRDEMKQNLKTN